jgi:hypothetical protein
MKYGSCVASIAKNLAAQEWTWERLGVERTLSSLGWKKRESVGHRVTYTRVDGPDAVVYHNADYPDVIEVGIDAFTDVDLLDALEYEDKVDEFYEYFLSATHQISGVLGRPAFSDGAASDGFPEDQDAVWLSLWNFPSARLMLQQKHEDRELPFRVCIVVAPPHPM